MRKSAKKQGSLGEDGQAIVEYVLTISVALFMVAVLSRGFRTSVFNLWQMITKDVSAPCPHCPDRNNLRVR